MNARELLGLIGNTLPAYYTVEEWETILRALRLKAAAEANDGKTPETDAEAGFGPSLPSVDRKAGAPHEKVHADFARRLERERNGLAARVTELEAVMKNPSEEMVNAVIRRARDGHPPAILDGNAYANVSAILQCAYSAIDSARSKP